MQIQNSTGGMRRSLKKRKFSKNLTTFLGHDISACQG
jgi:hypothetical protein